MLGSIPFDELGSSDLVVDAVYEGGTRRTSGDDPLSRLIPGVGNQGGFRQAGKRSAPRLVVLYSTLDDPDWPDALDYQTGAFTYFGDNKKPGSSLHDTPRGGNQTLRFVFNKIHDADGRNEVPPFLIFTKAGRGRDVTFRGLAVPGSLGSHADDLVAIWRSIAGKRFQNYRARFTILQEGVVARAWIDDVVAGRPSLLAPKAWTKWVETGICEPLVAKPTIQYRSQLEQTPTSDRDRSIIKALYEYFSADPYEFERFAAALVEMMDQNVTVDEVTRRSADGGRDAIGTYRLGPPSDPIALDFALEAKCYASSNGVGVKELSRLISRLRHRQFGMLVTTSYLARQAYEELRNDGHPVIVLSAIDIATILVNNGGLTTAEEVGKWLTTSFPKSEGSGLRRR